MQVFAKIVNGADRVLTRLTALVLVIALCYGGYALWDTYEVYMAASVDNNLLKYKPALDEHGEANPTLSELIAINPDVRAWLTIDDTHIDYPLLQGTDNVKYINTDVYGSFALSGSIFLDYRNAGDFSDPYSLVYGHHMDGGAMFGDLEQFVREDFFDQHQTGTLYLPDATYAVELFAVLQVDAFDEVVFRPTAEERRPDELVAYLRDNAAFYRDISLTEQDRIVGFSTCSQAATNARTVLFGRLNKRQYIPEGVN